MYSPMLADIKLESLPEYKYGNTIYELNKRIDALLSRIEELESKAKEGK
jgi:hypothetical protein